MGKQKEGSSASRVAAEAAEEEWQLGGAQTQGSWNIPKI
jgi:hypothetical protein